MPVQVIWHNITSIFILLVVCQTVCSFHYQRLQAMLISLPSPFMYLQNIKFEHSHPITDLKRVKQKASLILQKMNAQQFIFSLCTASKKQKTKHFCNLIPLTATLSIRSCDLKSGKLRFSLYPEKNKPKKQRQTADDSNC